MRAAISHKFAREYGMGTQQWGENIFHPGTFTGNPSLSVTVSHYMISLRRRKARAGQPVTSAKSMDEDTIRKLWEFNMFYTDNRTEAMQPISRKEKEETPTLWAGPNVRLMLQLLYITAMLCLLRSDEVLRIRWSHVVFEPFNGSFRIKITLPFRKTHQTGGIAPFYLYPNHAKPWMCPARAWSHWWTYMQANGGFAGLVFRRRVGHDRLSEHPEDALSPEAFMESFRLNLLDILVNPRPYGTHSFRRGGAQYLANMPRWPLTSICAWGGWTERYDNPGTIFKYLVSWTDTPTVAREDFFNPMRRGVDPCHMCGRTCHCA
ncbi:hypothetical protein BD410DRAFT_778284 [Rickenella mellea]|uniref:DNA breaking-rejoining enzyme n=1 Tax=Rickenella mellea TaxID=50990 RepID=A0A4Y7PI86_9AGAM|nr:hypothetical protein BD410DRAFT_778284 [Rickenella mellea]